VFTFAVGCAHSGHSVSGMYGTDRFRLSVIAFYRQPVARARAESAQAGTFEVLKAPPRGRGVLGGGVSAFWVHPGGHPEKAATEKPCRENR
jgi:hypothetical protein